MRIVRQQHLLDALAALEQEMREEARDLVPRDRDMVQRWADRIAALRQEHGSD